MRSLVIGRGAQSNKWYNNLYGEGNATVGSQLRREHDGRWRAINGVNRCSIFNLVSIKTVVERPVL